MKVYKDAHLKIISPYILWKNIPEEEFGRGITHFPVLVKTILNGLWHAKNSLI